LGYIALNGNYSGYELEKMWKAASVAAFEALSRHLNRGTEERHETLQNKGPPGPYLNPGSPNEKE
jgi:hypothetical protein